jgi:hypothetical protein
MWASIPIYDSSGTFKPKLRNQSVRKGIQSSLSLSLSLSFSQNLLFLQYSLSVWESFRKMNPSSISRLDPWFGTGETVYATLNWKCLPDCKLLPRDRASSLSPLGNPGNKLITSVQWQAGVTRKPRRLFLRPTHFLLSNIPIT